MAQQEHEMFYRVIHPLSTSKDGATEKLKNKEKKVLGSAPNKTLTKTNS